MKRLRVKKTEADLIDDVECGVEDVMCNIESDISDRIFV